MAEPIQFDPRIYGGLAPNTDPVPVIQPPAAALAPTVPAVAQPVTVDYANAVSKGSAYLASGIAQQEAARADTATVLESVGAAFSTQSIAKVVDWINAPSFTPRPGYAADTQMGLLKFTPSEAEDRYLRSASREEEFTYRLGQVEDQRLAARAMGDHPIISMAVSVGDLGYFALDAAGLGGAHLAAVAGASRAVARGVAGGVAASGAYAVGRIEQQVGAVGDGEIVLNALLNGAASAVAYRGGKFEKVDPKYPDAELRASANALQESLPDTALKAVRAETSAMETVARGGAVPQRVRGPMQAADQSYGLPVMTATQALDNIAAAGGEFAELAGALRQISGRLMDDLPIKQIKDSAEQRAYYHQHEHAAYLTADQLSNWSKPQNQRVVIHELAHGVTVQKLEYGLANPNSEIGRLASELEAMRVRVQAHPAFSKVGGTASYLNGNLNEFVAGLFWGGSQFTYALSKIPVAGYGSTLGKLVSVVRKMLGLTADKESVLTRALGLTEELIGKPLDVQFSTGKVMQFAPPSTGNVAAAIVKNEESLSTRAGNAITWNLHKTLGSFSDIFKQAADILVDNPVDMRGDSVVSQTRAIRADLASHQYAYEELLKQELAANGADLKSRILKPGQALAVQAAIEKEVAMEMLQRDMFSRQGRVPPAKPADNITRMADALDKANAAALAEMKASGVQGAEDIAERSGYFSRKWDVTKLESLEASLVQSGSAPKAARRKVVDMVARGMQRANPQWDAELAGDIANAVVSRTRAKGYFEDAAFRRHIGNEAAKEVREILSQSGISAERLQRAMDAITGAVDEAGKPAVLKHRIDIDMRTGITIPGGGTWRVADLIDTNMTRITEGYLDRAAANAALARKGLTTVGDIDKLRTEALRSVPDVNARAEAAALFDNTIAAIKGDPVGESMTDGMRKLQAITQMVGLSSSGLWQLTETANIMAKYGMVKTVGNMIKTMPGFGALLGSVAKDKGAAEHLSNVLMRNSSQDIRVRPFLAKLEDNFDMPISDAVAMSLTQAKQLVPYINAMRYVHHWQARLAGNLITDTFSRAAKGDAAALAALNKYGLESRTMDAIRPDLLAGGLDTAKWSDSTWAQVRGPLTKMMDDAVLRNRTGEIPAFAQFSQVGKFIFTFRSFVLGAHNKVLAGTLGREGFAGLGLLMAYQYPLTFLATAANEGIKQPSKSKTTEDIAAAALGQMGSLGLLGEFAGIITGEKQQFGAPGLIPIDRMYKAGSALAQGNAGSSAAAFLTAMPIISIIPGTKALSETLKD